MRDVCSKGLNEDLLVCGSRWEWWRFARSSKRGGGKDRAAEGRNWEVFGGFEV